MLEDKNNDKCSICGCKINVTTGLCPLCGDSSTNSKDASYTKNTATNTIDGSVLDNQQENISNFNSTERTNTQILDNVNNARVDNIYNNQTVLDKPFRTEPSLTDDISSCSNCGNNFINVDVELCPACRIASELEEKARLEREDDLINMKSPYIASILAILFGRFGAHRFYLRRYASAVIYIFFCWTPIAAIVANIEAIFIVKLNREQFYKHIVQNDALKIKNADNSSLDILIIVVSIFNIIRTVFLSMLFLSPVLLFNNSEMISEVHNIFRSIKEFFEYHF